MEFPNKLLHIRREISFKFLEIITGSAENNQSGIIERIIRKTDGKTYINFWKNPVGISERISWETPERMPEKFWNSSPNNSCKHSQKNFW